MTRVGGRARSLAAGVLLVGALAVLGAAPAQAAFGETIRSYDVTLTVLRNGDLRVSETIEYDFGAAQRHGIFRDIPTRVPYDQTDDRVYELDDVSVTSPTGAPADVDRSESAGVTSLRIGDPDETVTGRQVYDIDYTVHGALNAFEDHDELYWNAIGDKWDVEILAAKRRSRPFVATSQVSSASPGSRIRPASVPVSGVGVSAPCTVHLSSRIGPVAVTASLGSPATTVKALNGPSPPGWLMCTVVPRVSSVPHGRLLPV